MFKKLLFIPLFGLFIGCVAAQKQKESEGYIFKTTVEIPHSSVKNQAQTGTCWSFGGLSFLESEALRIKKKRVDLSEMQVVRHIYKQKIRTYYLRQGKTNFGEGALAHDPIDVLRLHGLMPQTAYEGNPKGGDLDHSKLVTELEKSVKAAIADLEKPLSLPELQAQAEKSLSEYMGALPERFEYEGKSYQGKEFAQMLGLEADNYLPLTSFSHQPLYQPFVLEVPDNVSNGAYINLSLPELTETVDFALENGYSLVWDGDVSELGFSHEAGLAVLPAQPSKEQLFLRYPCPEIRVTAEERQLQFENLATCDDHLMHLVGKATDQKGNEYYLIKNSWGSDPESNPYKGYLYMSKGYFQLKTVAVIVHKDGVPKPIRKKIAK